MQTQRFFQAFYAQFQLTLHSRFAQIVILVIALLLIALMIVVRLGLVEHIHTFAIMQPVQAQPMEGPVDSITIHAASAI